MTNIEDGYSNSLLSYVITLLEQKSETEKPIVFCGASFLNDAYLITTRKCASKITKVHNANSIDKFPGYTVRVISIKDTASGPIHKIENVYIPKKVDGESNPKNFGVIEVSHKLELIINHIIQKPFTERNCLKTTTIVQSNCHLR